jgi:hypothetical protein
MKILAVIGELSLDEHARLAAMPEFSGAEIIAIDPKDLFVEPDGVIKFGNYYVDLTELAGASHELLSVLEENKTAKWAAIQAWLDSKGIPRREISTVAFARREYWDTEIDPTIGFSQIFACPVIGV